MLNTKLSISLFSILVVLIVFLVFVPNLHPNGINVTAEPLTIKSIDDQKGENLSSLSLSFSIEHKNVNYYNNILGYLTYPIIENDSKNIENRKLPGIVMIHEWRGLEHIKNMAETLAKEGYVVLAIGLYNGLVANTTEVGRSLVNEVRENPSDSINNLQHAERYLASLENVLNKYT